MTPTSASELDGERPPEFLEMVGRLASAYCPQLLTTDVVDAARSALDRHGSHDMSQVETVTRAALDTQRGLHPHARSDHTF